jgi:hypothetical protein
MHLSVIQKLALYQLQTQHNGKKESYFCHPPRVFAALLIHVAPQLIFTPPLVACCSWLVKQEVNLREVGRGLSAM